MAWIAQLETWNCVDPDQLASLDIHCFQIKINLGLHVEGFWEIFIPREFLEPVISGRWWIFPIVLAGPVRIMPHHQKPDFCVHFLEVMIKICSVRIWACYIKLLQGTTPYLSADNLCKQFGPWGQDWQNVVGPDPGIHTLLVFLKDFLRRNLSSLSRWHAKKKIQKFICNQTCKYIYTWGG